MDHTYKAGELFLSGSNCAQAVVVAFSDVTGMDEKTSARISSAFGGGMGRMREVCGAVSGMLMVLSLLYGYEEPGENDCNKKALYREVQALAGKFREEVGSIVCREILKNPSSDPNPTPRTAEFYKQRPCARMVMTAARLLDEYIEEHPPAQVDSGKLRIPMKIENLSSVYSVRRLLKSDVALIFSLCCRNDIFYQYHPPFVTKDSILEDIDALPPNKTYDDKFYIGFFRDDVLIAVMDLILDYPREKTAFIGFFMMNMDYQGLGVGTAIIRECAAYLTSLGYQKIQLGIDKGNPQSKSFWTKNGFLMTGREVPNDYSSYLYMERTLYE